MSDTRQSNGETVTSQGDVVVTRELSRGGRVVVGKLQIRSDGADPVVVHVVDEFPRGLPIEAVGVAPGTEPRSGDISPQGAVIRQPVDGDPVEIEYDITLAEPIEERQFGPPVIRDVEGAATGRAPVAHTDGGEQSFASAEANAGRDRNGQSGRDGSGPLQSRSIGAVDDQRGPTPDAELSIDEVRESFEATLDGVCAHLADEVARLDTALATRDARRDAVRSDVDALDDRIETVESEVQTVRETALGLQAEFASVADEVAAMREELDGLRTELDDLAEVQESLAGAVELSTGDATPGDD